MRFERMSEPYKGTAKPSQLSGHVLFTNLFIFFANGDTTIKDFIYH